MKYWRIIFLFLFPLFASADVRPNENQNYENYHKQIIEAERLISEEGFREALAIYQRVFNTYDFIFSRDYQVAAQLALHLKEEQKAIGYIEKGIAAGWELKSIKKNKYLLPLRKYPEWKAVKKKYKGLRGKYVASLDQQLREKVKKMYAKDQWKAIGALLRIGEKAQEKYAVRKFAPHSEAQMAKLIEILEKYGYPGEKLIGNDFWISTILSHHNSISQEYSKKDTLYEFIRPKLLEAVKTGQMSPYEYAVIDDWYKAVASDRTEPGYGVLNSPSQSTLSITNELRQTIGLRTIELRNKLIDVENKMGMNFYLPETWLGEKITIE